MDKNSAAADGAPKKPFVSRRDVLGLFAAVVLALSALMAWWLIGISRMENFCQSIALGTPRAELEARVADHGFRGRHWKGPEPYYAIYDNRTMARFMCHVHFLEERVSRRRYVLND